MRHCAEPITDTIKITWKVFSDCYTTSAVFAPMGLLPTHANLKEDLVFWFKCRGENPLARSGAIKSQSRSHDQPNPEAFCWSVSSSLHILCPPCFHPTRLSADARTILQCAFGPRCGRAALRVSTPGLSTMLWQERCSRRVQSLMGSARILPLAPPHPNPVTCGPQ